MLSKLGLMSSECAATQLGAIHTRPPGCQLSLTPRLAYRSTLMWSAHTVLNTACVLCHALLLLGNRRSSKVFYSTALSLLSKKCCLVFLWFSHVAIVSYLIYFNLVIAYLGLLNLSLHSFGHETVLL